MTNMSKRGGNISGIIFKVIGILIIIGILIGLIYYFRREANYKIIVNEPYGYIATYIVTSIVYYGYDIGYDPNFDYANNDCYEENVHCYSGSENTNGIICIYAFQSKWDRKNTPASRGPLYIVGNVIKITNINTNTDIEYFDNEIDKYYYQDYWDSYYNY